MRIRPAFRERDDVEVTVLDALADRREEGMTVFELRSHVDADIDDLETALASLKADDLIAAEENGHRTVIRVDDRVIPDEPLEDAEESFVDALLTRLGL